MTNPERYQYYAFISYARTDEKWAQWLHKKLERYKLPNTVRKEYKEQLPERINPVFLDKTDIGIGNLKSNLARELEDSRYLVVICSPAAARSEWVNTEIEHFLQLGRKDRIIPFIVEGTPDPPSDNQALQCYPPALDKLLLGASVSESGAGKAFVKVVASLLSLKFDELWNRSVKDKQRRKKVTLVTAILTGVICLFAAFKFYQNYQQKKQAKRDAILARAITLRNSARRIALTEPSKAMWLYANACYLNPADSFFSELNTFYKKRTTAYADFADSAIHPIGVFNLFAKEVSPAFEYDTDTLDYEYSELVDFSAKRQLILTLHYDSVIISNIDKGTSTAFHLPGWHIKTWTYNDAANAIVVYAENEEEKEDMFLYNLDNKQAVSMYLNRKEEAYQTVLDYYIRDKGAEKVDPDSIMKMNFETGPAFYSMPGRSYIVFYNKGRVLGGTRMPDRKYGVINLEDPALSGTISLTGDVQYPFNKVWSINPEGDLMVVRVRNLDGRPKIYAFNPEQNQQLLLELNLVIPETPSAVGWSWYKDRSYCLMGGENATLQVRDLYSLTAYTLLTYQLQETPGAITAFAETDQYIIAGTAEGYLLAWKKDFEEWTSLSHVPFIYNAASMKISSQPIADIKTFQQLLMCKDAENKVFQAKTDEYIPLSTDIPTLKAQMEKLNITKLSAKDSVEFSL